MHRFLFLFHLFFFRIPYFTLKYLFSPKQFMLVNFMVNVWRDVQLFTLKLKPNGIRSTCGFTNKVKIKYVRIKTKEMRN